jgi:hypothetical protein
MNQPSRLTRDLLVKQFILSRSGRHLPADWPRLDRAGWSVATHPSDGLPIVDVIASCGSRVGWLIGFGVDLEAGLVSDHLGVPAEAADADFATAFERRVYELGGRYLAVLLVDGVARVYPDPCGSLAAVYSDRFEIVCSTTELLPEDEGSENPELADALDIPNRDNWYPFGLTSRHDARRLLPNHYLDLQSWQRIRQWPGAASLMCVPENRVTELEDEIGNSVETFLRSLVESTTVTMALTAGQDSRLLLACCRQFKDRIQFFTDRLPDRSGHVDCHVAHRLARANGLRHRVVRWQESSEEELEEWLFRTGRCVAGRTWRAARTARQIGGGTFKVVGLNGDGLRSLRYMREPDLSREHLTVDDLVGRLKIPVLPQVLDAAREWLDSLPVRDVRLVLDLLFLEQRGGCWGAPQLYGHVAQATHIVGFSHRRIIEGFLRLPVRHRLESRLPSAVIGRRWPELLDWPFNEFTGARAFADRASNPARRFLRNHPRVGRILRLDF